MAAHQERHLRRLPDHAGDQAHLSDRTPHAQMDALQLGSRAVPAHAERRSSQARRMSASRTSSAPPTTVFTSGVMAATASTTSGITSSSAARRSGSQKRERSRRSCGTSRISRTPQSSGSRATCSVAGPRPTCWAAHSATAKASPARSTRSVTAAPLRGLRGRHPGTRRGKGVLGF